MDTESRPDGGQRRRSAVARLAGKFRRGSAISQEIEQLDGSSNGRKGSAASIQQRKSSIASSSSGNQARVSLPLRLTRTRTQKTTEDGEGRQPSVPNELFELFFTLPNELQIQVLNALKFEELLALRLSHTSFFNLIHQNESPIVRHFIKNEASQQLLALWPPPQMPQPARFSYFLGLTRREIIVRGLATHIADFIMIKICRRINKAQQEEFHPRYQRIRSRCEPLILTLYHFFESYRSVLMGPVLNEALNSQKVGASCLPSFQQVGTHQEIEKRIIDRYDPKQLLQVHQMYKLLLAAFVRKLRPPSYAGRLERSLRGWGKTPASQDDIVKVLLVGGIREVKRIIEIKSYAARRKALDEFIETLTLPKEDDDTRSNRVVSEPPIALSSNPALVANSVERFVTAFLDEESLSRISRSFPELREIWSRTAENILLEKNVIDSVYEVPTMREFIESLMREGDDMMGLQQGRVIDDQITDGASENIEFLAEDSES